MGKVIQFAYDELKNFVESLNADKAVLDTINKWITDVGVVYDGETHSIIELSKNIAQTAIDITIKRKSGALENNHPHILEINGQQTAILTAKVPPRQG